MLPRIVNRDIARILSVIHGITGEPSLNHLYHAAIVAIGIPLAFLLLLVFETILPSLFSHHRRIVLSMLDSRSRTAQLRAAKQLLGWSKAAPGCLRTQRHKSCPKGILLR